MNITLSFGYSGEQAKALLALPELERMAVIGAKQLELLQRAMQQCSPDKWLRTRVGLVITNPEFLSAGQDQILVIVEIDTLEPFQFVPSEYQGKQPVAA